MSTGPGRLMRRIVEVVEVAEGRTMTRRRLEEIMVGEGYDRSNIRRGLRSLAERRRVRLSEGRTLDDSRVSVPEVVQVSNEWITEILKTLP